MVSMLGVIGLSLVGKSMMVLREEDAGVSRPQHFPVKLRLKPIGYATSTTHLSV
jgi:hypothetical protein